MSSVQFDTPAAYLSRTTSLPAFSAFTVCGWVKITSYEDYLDVFTLEGATNNLLFLLEADASGRLYGARSNADTFAELVLWTDAYAGWFFFGITSDASGFTCYFRKEGVGTLTTVGTLGANTYTPAAAIWGLSNNYGGDSNGTFRAAGLKIYGRKLTSAELLTESASLTPVSSTNLNWANTCASASTVQNAQSGTGGNFSKTGTPTDNADSPSIGTSASYTLTCANGSLSLTGQAVTLTKSGGTHTLTMGQGGLALTGQAVVLRHGYVMQLATAYNDHDADTTGANLIHGAKLIAAQGAYALSGQTATLRAAKKVALTNGALALTGQSAALRWGHRLVAVAGSLALTGQNVTLTYSVSRSLAMNQGSFALTGQASALRHGRTVSLVLGSLALSGQAVVLRRGRTVGMGQGTVALTGQSVALPRGRTVGLVQGSAALTGQSVALRSARRLAAVQGALAVTGYAVGLNLANARTLVVDQGALVLTGQATALRVARRVTGAQGAFAVTGQATALRRGVRSVMTAGALALTGQTLAFANSRRVAAATGTYSLTGQSVTPGAGRRVSLTAGGIALTGQAVTFSVGGLRLLADPGVYAVTGEPVALSYRAIARLVAEPGYFALTGRSVALRYSLAPVHYRSVSVTSFTPHVVPTSDFT